jgi:hypothetical protein
MLRDLSHAIPQYFQDSLSCLQLLQSANPHTRPGKNRLFLNLRRKKAMKKVPAISTSDSKAVLGWPRGFSCPDCPEALLLSGTSMVVAHVILLLLLLPASESLEPEQPWSGCSWKIWKGHIGPRAELGPGWMLVGYSLPSRNLS